MTSPKVKCTCFESVLSYGILSESWLEMKNTILNERVGSIVGVILKLPVSSATHGNLMLPSVEIKSVEIILENDFFCSIGS